MMLANLSVTKHCNFSTGRFSQTSCKKGDVGVGKRRCMTGLCNKGQSKLASIANSNNSKIIMLKIPGLLDTEVSEIISEDSSSDCGIKVHKPNTKFILSV